MVTTLPVLLNSLLYAFLGMVFLVVACAGLHSL